MKQVKYTWNQFDKDCLKIVKWIKDNNLRFRNVYGFPRGGLPLAIKLSHLLNIPLTVHTTSVHKDSLIVDDISDTGKTLKEFFNIQSRIKGHTVVTLFYKETSEFKPDFYVRKKNKLWISYPWER